MCVWEGQLINIRLTLQLKENVGYGVVKNLWKNYFDVLQ